MPEKLVQHRHCQVCLKAIPLGEEYCSEECKEKFNQLIRDRKKRFWITILWMVVLVIVLIMFLGS